MNHQQTFLLLSSCLVLSCFCKASADTIETTETTVTKSTVSDSSRSSQVSDSTRSSMVTEAAVVALAAGGNYVVVDPISGLPKGSYDPVTRLIDGRPLQAGLVIVDRPSGNLLAIIDSNGRAVDASVVPASEVLMVSINTRRKDLDQQIAASLNKGRLSASEASVLRAELDRIASDKEVGGSLSYRRALVAAYDLNSIALRVYPTDTYTPVISSQFVVLDQRLTMVDDVTYRKMQLLRRVDDEYQAGRLSANHVSSLKAQLAKISMLETQSRKRGEISPSKRKTLSIKLNQVESTLGKDVATINEKRARIGIRVD